MVLVAALVPCAGFAQEDRLRELYFAAQSAQQSGDLQTAARNYEEIVGLRPELAEAHANLGSIYYQSGDSQRAKASLEAALRLRPELAAPHYFLGVIASGQRSYGTAIQHLEAYARADPSESSVSLFLGQAYYAIGRYREAVREFWKLVSSVDFRVDAHYLLGQAYREMAEGALEQLVRNHPRSFYLYLARGHLHEGRQDWKEAEESYASAVRLRPAEPDLKDRLAWVRAQLEADDAPVGPPPTHSASASLLGLLYHPPSDRELDRRLADVRTLIGSASPDPSDPQALFGHAQVCQAAAYLAGRWIGLHDPGSYRAYQLRAQLLESRGEIDEAVRAYRSALRLKPGLREVHFAIGTLLWSHSRFDEALPELQAELRLNPNHAEAHYEVGDILQLLGRTSEASQHLEEALRIAPNMVEARLAIERIHFAAGRLEDALRELRRVAEIAPADPTPHYRMATILRSLGRAEESRKALAEFQRLQKD